MKKAKELKGTRFLQILAPCPPGWKFQDEDSIQIGREAVQNRIFPLMEVEDGARWRFTVDHRGDPVDAYLKKQGRFRHLKDWQIAKIQADVNERWRVLENRVRYGT